jgi:hypothetical protein
VETGDIQISLKGASHRAMTQTKFLYDICNVRSFSDEIIQEIPSYRIAVCQLLNETLDMLLHTPLI